MTANRPNPPEAPLIRAAYTRSQWQLTIDCPQCQHQHQHGGGPNLDSAHDYLGHRAAHCGTECVTHGTHQRGNGYILTDPDDVIGQAQHDHAQRDATAAGGPR